MGASAELATGASSIAGSTAYTPGTSRIQVKPSPTAAPPYAPLSQRWSAAQGAQARGIPLNSTPRCLQCSRVVEGPAHVRYSAGPATFRSPRRHRLRADAITEGGEHVDLVFLHAVPGDQPERYLGLLRQVTSAVVKRDFRDDCRAAESFAARPVTTDSGVIINRG